MEEFDIQMMRLGLNKQEKEEYYANRVEYNKKISKYRSLVREKAKRAYCYVCKKECSSFCKSHSVPKFCLKNIAINGKVYFSGNQKDTPFLGEDTGVSDAGTFQIICRECDSRIFQEYESEQAMEYRPTGRMMAQIALKNYLQMISKRSQEKELYSILKSEFPFQTFLEQYLNVIDLDLIDYEAGFSRAKLAVKNGHDDWYYLHYYKKLDYVVPFAFQNPIVLISDFEDRVINDIYNVNPDYRTCEMHIAVFPLRDSSAIIIFTDSRVRKYNKFFKQFNQLSELDKLASINYIAHAYSENVFISKQTGDMLYEDEGFMDTCRKSIVAISSSPVANPLRQAVKEFSLSNRYNIPNLLSKEYAIKV